jgi:hypothetical protein
MITHCLEHAPYCAAASNQISVCAEITRASSTSIPKPLMGRKVSLGGQTACPPSTQNQRRATTLVRERAPADTGALPSQQPAFRNAGRRVTANAEVILHPDIDGQ